MAGRWEVLRVEEKREMWVSAELVEVLSRDGGRNWSGLTGYVFMRLVR